MARANFYPYVQATISQSSTTKELDLYNNKLKAWFTYPHRVANAMNQQFAKRLNTTADSYLDIKQ
jgi:hypothetical protein